MDWGFNSLKGFNLTFEERIDLCYWFLFDGSVAYCLSKNDYDKCLEFASKDLYLLRICSLEEGKNIPTEGAWNDNSVGEPIPEVYFKS